jgi:hypothetical protein
MEEKTEACSRSFPTLLKFAKFSSMSILALISPKETFQHQTYHLFFYTVDIWGFTGHN